MLLRLALLLSLSAHTLTAAMPATPTLSNLSSLNGIFPVLPIFPPGLPEYQCVSLESWSRPDINWQEGCARAWGFAKNTEMYQTSTKFEFLPNNALPQYWRRRREMRTPRRYNLGEYEPKNLASCPQHENYSTPNGTNLESPLFFPFSSKVHKSHRRLHRRHNKPRLLPRRPPRPPRPTSRPSARSARHHHLQRDLARRSIRL